MVSQASPTRSPASPQGEASGTGPGDAPSQGVAEGESPSGPRQDSWPYVDRRAGVDRRARPTAWWDSILGRKRRVRGRRKRESRNIYVDLYDQWDLILTLAIFVLNIADAGLTLVFLGQGGSEANPLMAGVLGYGVAAFLLEKCLVVALCLLALVVHKTFRFARTATYFALCAYGLLTVHHLVLQLRAAAS